MSVLKLLERQMMQNGGKALHQKSFRQLIADQMAPNPPAGADLAIDEILRRKVEYLDELIAATEKLTKQRLKPTLQEDFVQPTPLQKGATTAAEFRIDTDTNGRIRRVCCDDREYTVRYDGAGTPRSIVRQPTTPTEV